MPRSETRLVLIKGAGDLASGVAARLYRCGFPIVMTELPQPLMVRRSVSFGEAIYEGETVVEGIPARRAADLDEIRSALDGRMIAVVVDPEATIRAPLAPPIVVDAIMAKGNTGTRRTDAPLVIALGPGFTAGVDCHAVVETKRGHWLGRVILDGRAQPDTGVPGEVAGRGEKRILRATTDGLFAPQASIGDRVVAGQVVASSGGEPVAAGCDGVLRGVIHAGLFVHRGLKVGDVDPRAEPAHCFTISDKSLAVAGGVLEAILSI